MFDLLAPSGAVLKAVVGVTFFAILIPFAKWALKTEVVRYSSGRQAQFTKNARWFFAPFSAIYLLLIFGPIPPIDGVFGGAGLMLFLLFVLAPMMISIGLSGHVITWDKTGVTRRSFFLPEKAIPWDAIARVVAKPNRRIKFFAGSRHLNLPADLSGVDKLVRYSRCRLKRNPKVVWEV